MSVPTTLYRLYDNDGRLLYVGITGDWSKRRQQHAADKPWWWAVAQVALATFPDRQSARRAELTAIRNERPAYNVEGTGYRPGDIIDRSPRIAWTCDTCDQPIAPGKGGFYTLQGSTNRGPGAYLGWYLTHWSRKCRAPGRRDRSIDIANAGTVDRFLMATWLVIDMGAAHRSNWTSIISRAQAHAEY